MLSAHTGRAHNRPETKETVPMRILSRRFTYERRNRHVQTVLARSPRVDFTVSGWRVYANGVLAAVTSDPDRYVFGMMGPATDTLDGFPVGLELAGAVTA